MSLTDVCPKCRALLGHIGHIGDVCRERSPLRGALGRGTPSATRHSGNAVRTTSRVVTPFVVDVRCDRSMQKIAGPIGHDAQRLRLVVAVFRALVPAVDALGLYSQVQRGIEGAVERLRRLNDSGQNRRGICGRGSYCAHDLLWSPHHGRSLHARSRPRRACPEAHVAVAGGRRG
jgi:hypothetical protein